MGSNKIRLFTGFLLATLCLSSCNNDRPINANEIVLGEETESCTALCTGAGFPSGREANYGGGLVECLCDGTGAGIQQGSCDEYCAQFGVGAEDAFVATEVSENDKCACDGTS